MAVGPVSRLPFTPLPDSRSLVPVSAVRASARTSKSEREAAKRVTSFRTTTPTNPPPKRRASAPKRPSGTAMPIFFPREIGPAPEPEAVRRGWSAPGTAPFVTQVLAQEVLKSGLHIEPWRQAIDAYERAAGAATPRLRPPMPCTLPYAKPMVVSRRSGTTCAAEDFPHFRFSHSAVRTHKSAQQDP